MSELINGSLCQFVWIHYTFDSKNPSSKLDYRLKQLGEF